MNLKDETNKLTAFELVAEALESLDRHQQSLNFELLKEAEDCLQAALKEDPNYFKAKYFLGMISYLWHDKTAADQFGELEQIDTLEVPVKAEIQYNRGAAFYQNGSYTNAIAEFENVRKLFPGLARSDVYLLACAGAALSHAKKAESEPDAASWEINEVYSLNSSINDILGGSYLQRWFLRYKFWGERIDPEVTRKAIQIAKKAKEIASKVEAQRPQNPVDPPISAETVA